MFFIVNITENIVAIGDLKFSLGPRQAIDLDKKYSREQSERSDDLKRTIRKGYVEVRRKDDIHSIPIVASVNSQNSLSTHDIENMKKDIIEGVKKGLLEEGVKNKKDETSKTGSLDVEDLATKIAKMINSNSQNQENKTEENEIDPAILADIHSKVVDKMLKNTGKSETGCEEQTIRDDLGNIDELEKLLG